ncbi:unnamed protein product [Moneuplotes crassus]|uniref:Uncharacterized protein n=1 Tax=Euplotes crassus TaxID=5936 RepID=A0AAD1XVR3_EUPCR|nr:unnamed protein product [Moneuplotes crassus]
MVKVTHLSLYTLKFPEKTYTPIRISAGIYLFFLCVNFIVLILDIISIIKGLEYYHVITFFIQIFYYVCTIAYVLFPKTLMGKSYLTIVIISIITILSPAATVVFIIVTVGRGENHEYKLFWFSHYMNSHDLLVPIIILFCIPLFLIISVVVVFICRVRIARKINRGEITPEESDDEQPIAVGDTREKKPQEIPPDSSSAGSLVCLPQSTFGQTKYLRYNGGYQKWEDDE